MIRTIHDFLDRWKEETEATLKIFSSLTDESLQVAIPGGRTLGRLANHITETVTELPSKLGLPIREVHADYNTVEELVTHYKKYADQLVGVIISNWDDSDLSNENNLYGDPWKNGFSLWVLLVHQSHHRAQMTVLMRMAGLKVPGIYGPTKEEWEAWGEVPLP
ncbi:DinB family protein [Longitalea luteola]|uniref:DinB family protein n=1 Tax=Longitalea luteola TaxID=2812563 RepID=UPI001A979D2B|nr:DinB family protein [Longitalea luteola]